MTQPVIITGDCRTELAAHGPFDMLLADPPYGDTHLEWDRRVKGWEQVAARLLKPTGSLWVFGSMRFFIEAGGGLAEAGLRYAQDLVWEKHNGSGFAADRLKRVHEHAAQFYLDDAPWSCVYNEVPRVPRVGPPVTGGYRGGGAHLSAIGAQKYVDDGTRIMRSVMRLPSMKGRAIHPTEKPVPLLEVLVRMSCPPDGLVGDLFAGSGAGGEACRALGRRYVGCEIDSEMAEKARWRLACVLPLGASVLA